MEGAMMHQGGWVVSPIPGGARPVGRARLGCRRTAGLRFEMGVASDDSVADVIKQLEELQQRVKSKKQELRKIQGKKKEKKTRRMKCDDSSSSSSESSSDEEDDAVEMSTLRIGLLGGQDTGLGACTKVEVCTGGKCKKNGSQQVLASFQGSTSTNVVATACKCMNQCKNGPNVRIQSDPESSPVIYNHVGPEDVESLLQQHQPQQLSLSKN